MDMAREKKAGSYVNVRLKESVYERLVEHCVKEDRTKTSMIERALTMYFDKMDMEDAASSSPMESSGEME